ncbi:hypothetical protein GCM10009525_11120 [Streptosporangium amethystogenes subsp. fukuiense]
MCFLRARWPGGSHRGDQHRSPGSASRCRRRGLNRTCQVRRGAASSVSFRAEKLTNTVFGILRAYVLIALWQARPGLAGYDLAGAVTAGLILGVAVSFALRYLVALSACWMVNDRGVQSLSQRSSSAAWSCH